MVNNTFYVIPKDSDLTHYGVQGMKWGVRKKSEYVPTGRPVGRPRTNLSKSQYSSKSDLKKKSYLMVKKLLLVLPQRLLLLLEDMRYIKFMVLI